MLDGYMNDIASSFCKNIETMDFYSFYHKRWKSTRYSQFGYLNRLNLVKMCDGNIKKYDVSLWKRVHEECKEIGVTPPISKKDRLYSLSLLVTVFLAVFFLFAFIMFNLVIFAVFSFPLIVISIILGLLILKEGMHLGQKAIKKSHQQKNLVQELIYEGINFFKKESVDPADYQLKLKFNDYYGLKLIKVKRNLLSKYYFFYLDLDAVNVPEFIENEISEQEMYREAVISFIRTSSTILLLAMIGASVLIVLHYGYLK
jgi:hypothetical protein